MYFDTNVMMLLVHKYFVEAVNNLPEVEDKIKQQIHGKNFPVCPKNRYTQQWECYKIEPTLSNIVKILKTLGITFEDLIE